MPPTIVRRCALLALVAVSCGRGGRGGDEAPPAQAGAAPAMGPRAIIVSPADGDTVGPEVRVTLRAEGVHVVPADGMRVLGQGHHHLFVDTDPTPAGLPIPAGVPGIVHIGTGDSAWTLSGLAPGAHRLIAVLAYGDHVPMTGVAPDTVRIVVRP